MQAELHGLRIPRLQVRILPAPFDGAVAQLGERVNVSSNLVAARHFQNWRTAVQFEELQVAFTLQQRAYSLLMWINRQAAYHPELLDEASLESFRSSEGCEEWLRRRMRNLPLEMRAS